MRLVVLILLLAFAAAALANEAVGQVIGLAITIIAPEFKWVGYLLMIGSSAYGAEQARKRGVRERERQRQAANDAMRDRAITRITSEAPHRYLLGEGRIGSDIVAMFTSGDKDQFRWLVCVHAAHEVDSVLEYYVAGKALGALDNGWVTGGDYSDTVITSTYEGFFGPTITLAHTPIEGTVRVIKPGSSSQPEYAVSFTLVGSVVTVEQYDIYYKVYYDYATTTPRVRVISHLGGAADPADAALREAFPSLWPSTAVLRGYFYSVVMLDLNQPEFQSGVVPIEVRARGMKLHDPRDASYPDDIPLWSQNPALVALWYLRSELCEIPLSDIPLSDYITAANACSPITGCTYSQAGTTVTVNKTAHGRIVGEVVEMKIETGTALSDYFTVATATADQFTYMPYTWNGRGWLLDSRTTSGNASIGGLFTFNGTISADQEPPKVLDEIAKSMAGGIVNTTWSCWAGVYTAPVMALTQDDVVGRFETIAGAPASQIENGVRGQYISPLNNYVVTDFTPYQNAAYLAADGVEKWENVDFPYTDSVYRVHNLCRISVEDQRNGFTVRGIFSLKAYKLKIGQRCTFTSPFFGMVTKVFRLTDRKFGMEHGLELTLKEDGPATYDKADATTPEVTPNSNLANPFTIVPPSLFTFEQSLIIPDRGELRWVPVPYVFAHQYQVEYMGQLRSKWTTLSPISDNGTFIDNLPPDTYSFRVKTINPVLNVHSAWSSVFHGTMAVFPVPNVSGLEIFGRGISTIFGGKHCRFTWRKTSVFGSPEFGSEIYGANAGARDYYFKDYVVKIFNAAGKLVRHENILDENYIYTYEHNAEDHGGIAARNFTIKVWQRGKYGQLSAIAATLDVSNPVPSTPVLMAYPGSTTVNFDYAEPQDLDWSGITIWLSATDGFTADAATLAYDGVDTSAFIGSLLPNTPYFFRYAVKDVFGPGSVSAQLTFTTSYNNNVHIANDSSAPINLKPHGATGYTPLSSNADGAGALLSSMKIPLPLAGGLKLSASSHGHMSRTGSVVTLVLCEINAVAGKNFRKLSGATAIDSAGTMTGTGTGYLAELGAGSMLLLGNNNGNGSLTVISDFASVANQPVQSAAPTTNTACALASTLDRGYKDTTFSFSGEVWAFDPVSSLHASPGSKLIPVTNETAEFTPFVAAQFTYSAATVASLRAAGAEFIFVYSNATDEDFPVSASGQSISNNSLTCLAEVTP